MTIGAPLLVQDVEPDALLNGRLDHPGSPELRSAGTVMVSDFLGLGIDSTGDGPKGSPAPPQPWRLGAFAAPGEASHQRSSGRNAPTALCLAIGGAMVMAAPGGR